MTKEIYDHIVKTALCPDKGESLGPVTSDMFHITDITRVVEFADGESVFAVQIRGLNGIIPLRMFDEESKRIIIHWYKSRKTPLWRVLNDSD